jgi:hypothetical protein
MMFLLFLSVQVRCQTDDTYKMELLESAQESRSARSVHAGSAQTRPLTIRMLSRSSIVYTKNLYSTLKTYCNSDNSR